MRLNDFYRWYIKGEYHCHKCPYSWEDRGYDDADAGCYIKGDIQDKCRLLPPFRFAVGYFRKKRFRYYAAHQYDGYPEFADKNDRESEEFNRLLLEMFSSIEMYRPYLDKLDQKEYIVVNKKQFIEDHSWDFRYKYDEFAHPFIYESIGKRWKKLIIDTLNNISTWFRIYFGRSE